MRLATALNAVQTLESIVDPAIALSQIAIVAAFAVKFFDALRWQ